jgi:hypothetical protein
LFTLSLFSSFLSNFPFAAFNFCTLYCKRTPYWPVSACLPLLTSHSNNSDLGPHCCLWYQCPICYFCGCRPDVIAHDVVYRAPLKCYCTQKSTHLRFCSFLCQTFPYHSRRTSVWLKDPRDSGITCPSGQCAFPWGTWSFGGGGGWAEDSLTMTASALNYSPTNTRFVKRAHFNCTVTYYFLSFTSNHFPYSERSGPQTGYHERQFRGFHQSFQQILV